MNNYNYYPNSEYNRNQMDYNDFLNYLGLNGSSFNMNMNNGMTDNINDKVPNSNNNLYGSYEGYTKGNMFRKLYKPYKNYEPERLTPDSEKDEALLNLGQMHFAMHEANLYLDVFPNDREMMREYVKSRDSYNELLNNYEERYGALNVNSSYLDNTPFGWEEENWPWDRRDK